MQHECYTSPRELRIECPKMAFENPVSRYLRIECPEINIEYRVVQGISRR